MDVVVATSTTDDPRAIAAALSSLGRVDVEVLVDEAPVHWWRVRSVALASRHDVSALLSRAGLSVRYVASARRSDMTLGPPLDFRRTSATQRAEWSIRASRARADPPSEGGRWFLGPHGVRLDRRVCGSGAGIRIAVVDDDAADADNLDVERVVRIGPRESSAASGHGALMVGWAVGARRPDGSSFAGVAPDASARLYLVPKPGEDVVSFPLAIVRASLDGADVVVCATYLEATTSPMLDDALELAQQLGRRGRGTIVVLPTGRETSSPGSSVHASLSLALGDPASDPRVHCVAPSGRAGGWFLWRDSRGKLRPFANRGPAVRWLAPGDDLAYPFASKERLFHAESSGASAVAAGVLALVLGANPELRLPEVHALLARTVEPPEPHHVANAAMADPADILPAGRDRDGHDAKCGYGRLDAARACAGAGDPFSLALSAIGEDTAAQAWCDRPGKPYSTALARWAVSALLARPDLDHAVRVLVRHARLVAGDSSRAQAHAPGALARQLGVIVRELMRLPDLPSPVREELAVALAALRTASRESAHGLAIEDAALKTFDALWEGAEAASAGSASSTVSGSALPE